MNTKDNRKSRRLILLAAGLLVIALVAGGGVLYLSRGRQTGGQAHPGPKATIPQYAAEDLRSAVDKANASGDFAKTVTLLETQSNQSPQTKLMLAEAYANDKQYDKSLAVLAALDGADQLSASSTMMAAEIAEAAGKPQTALGFYRKAKTRLTSEHTHTSERELSRCDRKIAELEAKPK